MRTVHGYRADPAIRAALDRAADRALAHPGDLIAAALLAAVALTCLGYALGRGTR